MGIARDGIAARHARFRLGGQLAPHRLTARAKNAIEEADDAVWVSAISFFEIAQKARLGKWPEVLAVADSLPKLHETQGGRIAPLDAEICVSAGSLPWPHRDPFDRLIAATRASPGTTQLYDRTGDEVTLDEVERITI
jgi:PIN domain nuclease of toxin-antitoxin system